MFEGFDFTNFWEDSAYALEEYVSKLTLLADRFEEFIRVLVNEDDFELED